MAEAEIETVEGAPEAPEPAPSPGAPVEDRGAARLERALRGRGIEPATAEQEIAGSRAGAPPAPTDERRREVLTRQWQERREAQRREIQERAAAAERGRLLREFASLEEKITGALPKPEGPEEPDFDQDPRAWYKYMTEQGVLSPLQEKLSAIESWIAEERQRREAGVRAQTEEQQASAWAAEQAEVMLASESCFSTPEERAQYQRHLSYFHGSLVQEIAEGLGVSPAEADNFARLNLVALTDQAVRRGIPPALAVESMARGRIASTLQFLGANGWTFSPPQAGAASPAAPTQRRPVDPRIAAQQEVARSAESGGSTPSASATTTGRSRGQANLLQFALSAGGDHRAVIQKAQELHGGNWQREVHKVQRQLRAMIQKTGS